MTRTILLMLCAVSISNTASAWIVIIPNPFVPSDVRDKIITSQLCQEEIESYRRCLEQGYPYPFECVKPKCAP